MQARRNARAKDPRMDSTHLELFVAEVYFLPLILSTLFIYYWVGYQIMYRRMHSEAEMSPIWHNFVSLFRFERTLALAFSPYAIWQSDLVPEKYYYLGAGIILMLMLNCSSLY